MKCVVDPSELSFLENNVDPTCSQVPLLFSKTLTEAKPPEPLDIEPIATKLPSDERDTECPERLFELSPPISLPICSQVPLLFLKILTCPLSVPLSSLP